MVRVLVPDYLGQHVLSGIRSLAWQGDAITLAGDINWIQQYIFRSCAIKRYIHIPNPYLDQEGYIERLFEILKNGKFDLILPFGLGAYYALSYHKQEILKYTNAILPDFDTLNLANDKLASTLCCQQLGIETPRVYSEYQENDVRAIAREVQFPVVVKARGGSGVDEGLRYATDSDELIKVYEDLTRRDAYGAYNPKNPLIQEFIPGYIHDACTLTYQGVPVNILTQIRQIMYPVTGGVGAVNITTDDPVLKELASRILEGFNWHGPAQIEFKYDPRDGKYKFIEFNPKLWGTLDLSIQAGMDYPGMIRDLCLGKDVKRNKSYEVGLRYIFRYKQYYRAKRELTKIKGWRKFYHFLPFVRTKMDFSWKDPLPDLFRMAGSILTGLSIKQKGKQPSLQFVLNGYED